MSVYGLHGIAVTVEPSHLEARTGLGELCSAMAAQGAPASYLSKAVLRIHGHGVPAPPAAAIHHRTDAFDLLEDDQCSYVTDGVSTAQVRADGSTADAYLDESFHEKPRPLQWQFWSYCLLKLLRPSGYFSLHTAALVSPQGRGMLIAGPSGVGKSTIAIGLIRAGWGYLSDDAVLLRRHGGSVTAFPLRRQFYVDAAAAAQYADMRLGAFAPDATGDMRRQVHLEDRYGHLCAAQTTPRVLVFPTIVDTERSVATPLDEATTLHRLLSASGPQLFDRAHMRLHLATLRDLVSQSASYRVDAGRDLRRHPARVLDLIPCGGRT